MFLNVLSFFDGGDRKSLEIKSQKTTLDFPKESFVKSTAKITIQTLDSDKTPKS